MRRDRIDVTGAGLLLAFSLLMGINHVLIKLVNAGFSPAFQAGLRSICAFLPVLIYAWWSGRKLSVTDGSFGPGMVAGLFFSVEFLLLFNALEYTSVNRASVLFYTMPVWVALGAHFLIPGEGMSSRRALGLILAVCGVAWAMLSRAPDVGPDAWIGDLMCLVGAFLWAGIALTIRLTRLSRAEPEMQLLYQLGVSAIVVTAAAPLFGPIVRDVTPEIIGIFSFQVLVVVCLGFSVWFWMLRIYPASDMAAFSFLAPVFGVISAWLILGEPLTAEILVALILVGAGIVLVSWKPRR
ncbi:MAG: DMT family transporter [Pseudomonadota bacterium]